MNLEEHIGFIISKTIRNLNSLFNREFMKYGITSEQWSILKGLEKEEGVSINELTQIVAKDQSNVTRILHLLEKRGLIQKVSSPIDKRSALVFFTSEGKQLTEELTIVGEKVHKIAVKGLTEGELTLFKDILSKLNQNSKKE